MRQRLINKRQTHLLFHKLHLHERISVLATRALLCRIQVEC